MHIHHWTRLGAVVGTAALAAGLLTAATAGATTPASSAAASAARHVKAGGTVTLSLAREVDVSTLPDLTPAQSAALAAQAAARPQGTLRMDGTRSMSPARAGTPASLGKQAGAATPAVVTPTRVLQNFAGTTDANSSCGCQPPDSNGAVNKSNVVEAVNLALSVWTKAASPVLVKRTAFASLLGTSDGLSDPSVLYDNVWNRWVLTIIPTTNPLPRIWIAVSQTSSPTGKWWIYRGLFGGGLFPSGTLMDYPKIGMDQDSVVISTNNINPSYINSAVWSVAKARIYNGQGWSIPAFGVDFTTVPSVVAGVPMNQDGKLYLLSSLIPYGLNSVDVYAMTNSSRPDSVAVSYIGRTANFGFGAPSVITQPGGGSLDSLDGRFQWAPSQLGSQVWFARATGFPVVQYGFVDGTTLAVTSAVAHNSGPSQDWNPSISVGVSSGNRYVFLNWAYVDTTAGTNVATRISGLGASDSVQNLVGIGTTLAVGSHGFDTRFGDFSSVSVDPSTTGGCPAGRSAYVANEQFDTTGDWVMRNARVGFC